MSSKTIDIQHDLDEDGNGVLWYKTPAGVITHYIVYRNHRVRTVTIFDDECFEVKTLQNEEEGTFTKKTHRCSDGFIRTTMTKQR